MDVALVSVIVSGVLGLSTGGIAVWSNRRAAALAREQRVEQRAADAYLKLLLLAEQEAQWFDACVHNFGQSEEDIRYGADDSITTVTRPPLADRATASALIAAHGSVKVHSSHAAWRTAADQIGQRINAFHLGFHLDGDPFGVLEPEQLKEFKDTLQPTERDARRALADVIAAELGHR